MGLLKIFSQSLDCNFILLNISFVVEKLLRFRRFHLLTISLSVCAIGVIFRKRSPVKMGSSVLTTFCSVRFKVVGFMCVICLNVSFVYGDRYGSILILLHVDIQICHQHL